MATKKTIPPIHQWTNGGEYVLILKCVKRDGTGHGEFLWPKSGPVTNPYWSRDPTCDSGGLFGWAWGMGIGEGRDPDACAPWIVFRAKPENVILVDSVKVKAVPGEDGEEPEVVFYGEQADALAFVLDGQIAWIANNAKGKSKATDWRGSASATGWRGSASATGERGSASATGLRGSASATGESGSASATGENGSASATGWRGSASATGSNSAAICVGYNGKAKAGDHGIIVIAYRDTQNNCTKWAVGVVGDNIKENTWYRCDNDGNLVEVQE